MYSSRVMSPFSVRSFARTSRFIEQAIEALGQKPPASFPHALLANVHLRPKVDII
jgi:hypothetical protein